MNIEVQERGSAGKTLFLTTAEDQGNFSTPHVPTPGLDLSELHGRGATMEICTGGVDLFLLACIIVVIYCSFLDTRFIFSRPVTFPRFKPSNPRGAAQASRRHLSSTRRPLSSMPLRGSNTAKRNAPRRKVALACERCREKKIRCDGQKPICGPCSRRGLTVDGCIYKADNARSASNDE